MTPTQHRVIALFSLVALMTISVSAVARPGTPESAETSESGPARSETAAPHAAVAGAIERAFSRNEGRLLQTALPKRGKVYLSTRTLGVEDGYYGPDQLMALLDRMFRLRPTHRFTWEQQRSAPSGQPVSLTAVWRYRPKDGSRSSARLRFVVAPGGSGWFVREIRESN